MSVVTPARAVVGTDAPYLELTWTDPVTGLQGFLVIDRLVRGVCSGGLRVREGCTLAEVRGLAAGMTLKEGLYYRPENRYVPLGGAKGGIDCSPHDPRMRGVLSRYLQGVRALLERHWTTGEDLGLQQKLIDEVVTELGLESSIQAVYPLLDDKEAAIARLAAAFAVEDDGIGLGELAGGLGVAEAVLTALDELGRPAEGTRVVIQGFGSMGGATARYLARAGLKVVGIADANGVIANPAGLDVEALLRARDDFGEIDRSVLRSADVEAPGDEWLAIDTDVLVPAAISYCVTPANQHEVRAALIAEAANLPVLPEAEAMLTARGVHVVPDFVANSATNAWWWWTLFGDIGADAAQADRQIRTEMRRIVSGAFVRARADRCTLREAARAFTAEQLLAIDARFGQF
ncbi:Glu/Leu/Phe/Val dehydrogenase dimerization domain-containing protein [Kribbella catacumbae]|uniref:Glu/Leu/Phe/Val dehydrogenase dimerization domain-containing protein n=1 Tax=Kribbella catacumbae TaxID=460086 RepID=UPI0003697375|nr:Glu/Leu/Phe/Val dehydrogenase dimerization domain-containing protein [Kribbella catacumbae]